MDLPHFGVQNINKPGKIRFVFDDGAKTAGISFNDLLLPGPDLLRSLPGVLMRHREFFYAFKGVFRDIFLGIEIRDEDKNMQRFLDRGSDRSKPPEQCILTKVLFGANSSPSTALYIKDVNALRFQNEYPAAVKSIRENCYMDDLLDSCVSPHEASVRIAQVIEINVSVGWEMHGWESEMTLLYYAK